MAKGNHSFAEQDIHSRFNAIVGHTVAEERELEVWLHGYMDPYEGEIDTAKYSMAEIVSKLFSN